MTTKPGKYDVLATCFMAVSGAGSNGSKSSVSRRLQFTRGRTDCIISLSASILILNNNVKSVPDTRGSVGHVSDPDRSSGWLFRQSKVSKYGVKKPPPRLRPGEFFTSILSLSDAPAKVLTAKCPSDFA